MADENMTKRKVLQLYSSVVFMVVAVLSKTAVSTLVVHFNHAPPARSRFSTAVFQYSVKRLDGSNPCKKDVCSFSCELDGQVFPCRADSTELKNLTVNQKHKFLINVTSHEGERNSSAYSWFIDTIPPTAIISSEEMYTNAKKITVNITFSEPCTGLGGFSCLNSTNCDVMVTGPAHVLASSLQIIRPGTKYSLELVISSETIQGRTTIRLKDNICADQAGNLFKATNASALIIHIDRRPVIVDFWTSVPSYELIINKVPRTVVATSKREDLTIFLHFSISIRNSTEQILKSLHVNAGLLIPIHARLNENRKFAFKLKNISGTEIINIELQTTSILGRTGTPVSPVAPITFLYDSIKPDVVLRTSSPNVTKESDIDIIVEFTKPVFGFEASVVEVLGGRLIRLKELSRALYSLTVKAATQTVVSVTIPAGKVTDISGNENMASNQLEVKHYSTPPISIGLHSFVTAGTIATSLVAALVSVSSANLEALSMAATGVPKCGASVPLMNLHGMVGHLQVFALTYFFSVKQSIEYSETTRGLLWLLPRHKLPWKDYGTSVWANNFILTENYPMIRTNDLSVGVHAHIQDQLPFPIETTPKSGWSHHHNNINVTNTFYGLPLSSSEYFTYFLRGEPLSAMDVVKNLEVYEGWGDLEMNLFWLGVGGGSLLLIHLFTLYFIRWRTRQPAHGSLSFPRFELLLLILMLPCISQSSMFVIKGGTTGGIITGALLLAIPVAFILSVSLFLVMAIFSGSFARYKEVRNIANEETWYKKFWFFFTGRPTTGKWFYKEGLSSSFLPRFGILFESWKGIPVLVYVDQNDPSSIAKWTENGQSGNGRMKAVSSDDSNEEIKSPLSKRVLGCARSSYFIIDLLRRVGLGIISVAYSSEQSSKSLFALIITLTQFIYLLLTKPYIRRGVQVVESFSLLCEVGVFGIYVIQNGSNPVSIKTSGYVLLVLLMFNFTAQLVYQWYAIIRSILRLSQHQKNSFKQGLEFTAKGLILPFLPREHWSAVIAKSKTGPENRLSSGLQLERRKRNGYMDPISVMTATVVPVLSPGGLGPNVIERRDPTTSETDISEHREAENKQLKAQKAAQKDDMKKLRELARASFLLDSRVEDASRPSTSYASEKQPFSGKSSLSKPK
ncbi:hypothetical protein L6164_009051 [Bauhinia variegata]|uniref:Uncharacterized protein n=1 Tax=Bauhinia variegata TaxID=167791 RepID=A0ACB9PLG2_BAUVA|nr:hypothetical protein L6164_009051 [Bauhinia variegata]